MQGPLEGRSANHRLESGFAGWLLMGTPMKLLLGLLGIVLIDPTMARGENWPSWRGRTGLGYTTDKSLPLKWGGKDNANVLWKVPLFLDAERIKQDENRSSPIVWGDRVFITLSYWPDGVSQKEYPEHHVVCLQASDGKRLWDTRVQPGPWRLTDLRGGYTAPTPATDGERVYVLFGSAVLAALDFDGRIVWRKDITPFTFDVAIGTSPILYNGLVMVLCDQTNTKQSRLAAFDQKTGEIKWETKRPEANFSHSTPVIVSVNGKAQMLVAAHHALQGLDPASGAVIWSCKNKGDVPTPAYGSGLVYAVDGRGGPGIAVDPTGAGDVTKTHIRWTAGKVPDGAFSSPMIVNGLLHQLLPGGVLKCWKMANGELMYTERLAGASDRPSPVATVDGRIYFASGGKSFVIQAGPRLAVLAMNELGDAGEASPAAADGRLFLKGRRYMFCVGAR
jgi:outer membrane protein assembly factor BamB